MLAGPRVCHKDSVREVCESWEVLGWLMAAVLLPCFNPSNSSHL